MSKRLFVHTSPVGEKFLGPANATPWPRERDRCEAHARSTGKPCVAPAMKNGRCRRHGGLSTGPKSAAARERLRQVMLARWAAKRGKPPATFPQPA